MAVFCRRNKVKDIVTLQLYISICGRRISEMTHVLNALFQYTFFVFSVMDWYWLETEAKA